jgi:hypothetical protein
MSRSMTALGQKAKYSLRADIVRFAPETGPKSAIAGTALTDSSAFAFPSGSLRLASALAPPLLPLRDEAPRFMME